jgi:hypothetical protein
VPVYDCSEAFSGWGKRDSWHFSADSSTAAKFARLIGCLARVSRAMDWLRSYAFAPEFDREPKLWEERALTLQQVDNLQNKLHQRWQPNKTKEPARDPAVRPPGFIAFMPPPQADPTSADVTMEEPHPSPPSGASPAEPAPPSYPPPGHEPPPVEKAPSKGRPCPFTDVRLQAPGTPGPWDVMAQPSRPRRSGPSPPSKPHPLRKRGSSRPPVAAQHPAASPTPERGHDERACCAIWRPPIGLPKSERR